MSRNEEVKLSPEEIQAKVADRALWSEVFRLLTCAREKSDADLLDALLNGREPNIENVQALYIMAGTHFELDVKSRIQAVCSRSLGPEETKKLQAKTPRTGGILEEMGYNEPEEEQL